jgi:hypothetical protein
MVRLERIERSSLAYRASALTIVLQAGSFDGRLQAMDSNHGNHFRTARDRAKSRNGCPPDGRRLHESGWQDLHLRPRGSEPRRLLLTYTQSKCAVSQGQY